MIDSATQKWDREIEDKIHKVVEMPLNHLGLVVQRHDIRQGPPPEQWLDGLRAVVTWFDESKTTVPWLWPWLEERAKEGNVRFVHLGLFGPLLRTEDGGEDPSRLIEWLERFGLGYDDYYVDVPLGIGVEFRDEKLCAYETDPRPLATHFGVWNTSGANVPWVKTTFKTDAHTRTPVITGSWGAVALDPFVCEVGSGVGDRRWHLDPFAFFAEAMGMQGVPAPHPSVLNGRRMFIFHVDGDGFESISTVRYGKSCGQVFLDEILERYDLPVTASVIIRSLTRDLDVKEPTRLMETAKAVFRHPNVESATHTVLHPYNWLQYQNGVREKKYQAFMGLANYEATPENEVIESHRFINKWLLEDGRKCEMMLWSGDATPREDIVKLCEEHGRYNFNGGLFRWDDLFDSVGYVSPWGRAMETTIQVYTGASNENVYDGYFTTMPSAFRHVDDTIFRTGQGRILKPANLYVHFYSVERPGRIRVFHHLIRRWGLTEPTAPVWASAYTKAVISATKTARVRKTAKGWRLDGFNDCRTARIDGEERYIDWSRSKGLVGARRLDGALYLHLSEPNAEVVFSDVPVRWPHVEQANHIVEAVTRDEKSIAFTSTGVNRREVVFAGLPVRTEVTLKLDGEPSTRRTDGEGRLRVIFPPGRPTRVEVRIP